MMGITRKLLKDLASQIDRDSNRTELITKTKEFFSSLKITLWSPKSPSAQDEFAEVIRRSSLNRTQLLVIIENSKKLIALLREYGKSQRDLEQVN